MFGRYVHQDSEEYDNVKKARRPGRPASAREDLLRMKIEALETEQRDGFCKQLGCHTHIELLLTAAADVPDLTTESNIQLLDRWDGSWTYLPNLAWVHISGNGNLKAAKFPPQSN